jgi:hypothetical protein
MRTEALELEAQCSYSEQTKKNDESIKMINIGQ